MRVMEQHRTCSRGVGPECIGAAQCEATRLVRGRRGGAGAGSVRTGAPGMELVLQRGQLKPGVQGVCSAARGGGGVGTRPRYLIVCLWRRPSASRHLHNLTLCGSERVLVVSMEPPDDLSCLTTPGVGRPGDGAVARAVAGGRGGVRDPKFVHQK